MEWLRQHVGEIAALGTATCWVFSSLTFAGASRRIGPTAVNVIRMLLALVLVGLIHRFAVGHWIPKADGVGMGLLAVSGLIGFAIGDQFFFRALVDIGPRLSTVLMTLTPPVAALLALPVLNEPLALDAVVGMIITLAGIAWVALERPDPTANKPHPHRLRGLIAGSLAAICQAIGLVLSKLGIGHTRTDPEEFLDPWSASVIRLAFGAASICVLAALHRAGRSATIQIEAPESAQAMTNEQAKDQTDSRNSPEKTGISAPGRTHKQLPKALLLLSIGTLLGPVIGVWLSLVSIDHAKAAIASTLMAMTPVLILPFAVWIDRERISWRAAIGAVVAVTGVAILTGICRPLLSWLIFSVGG